MVSMICKKCKKEFDSEDIEKFDRHLEYIHGIPFLQMRNKVQEIKALLEEILGEAGK